MTDKTPKPIEIQRLQELLQERLQSEQVFAVAFQVRGALQKGALLIMTQHAPPLLLDTQPLFSTLEQAIQTLQPEFAKEVSLFVRVTGQKEPYAAHKFTVEEPVEEPVFSLGDAFSETENALAFETEEVEMPAIDSEYQVDETEEFKLQDSWTVNDDSEDIERSDDGEYASDSIEEPILNYESESEALPKKRSSGFKVPLPVLAVGAGVAGLCFLGGLYAITRPCVVGTCVPLQKAQQLSQESEQTLSLAKGGQDLLVAQKQLTEATQLLKSIPPWSSHHASAENLLQANSTQAEKIDPVLAAFSKATLAAQKSQNPPHPLQDWQEIQSLWMQAIAQLRQVSPNSPLYRLAQQKLPDYQLNLATINQRVKTQQQAELKLQAAQQAAQVAEGRQGNARSLENWQQVYASWQTATNTLSAIPKTSTVYAQAQQLLETYQPKLAAARDRKTKEQISANNYNQAVSLAGLAKRLEQQNQWTQAVATWRQALTYVDQVPNETFYYDRSQQLSDTYANSLKQAEDRLKISLVFQKARADLERTCAGSPRICNYTVSNQGIRVYLTPAYVNRLLRTAVTADLSGDVNTQVDLEDHLQTLQAALEAISENANLPLEIYDHRRSRIGSHTPK